MGWYENFRTLNIARCQDPEGFGKAHATIEEWSEADWMNAVVGELGELANLLKKRRRGEYIAQQDVSDEWADVFTYLDLLGRRLNLDPQNAVMGKFHRVSERIGWSVKPAMTKTSRLQ